MSIKKSLSDITINFLKKNKEEVLLNIDGLHYTIVNTIRRALYSLVETYSFNTFEIIKNETKLPNEFITHRIEIITFYNYIKY